MRTTVKPGLAGVQGAKYKVEMSFAKGAGILKANQTLEGNKNASRSDPPFFEAIVNISSNRILSQIDATKDFSFADTAVDDRLSALPDSFVQRLYENNTHIPVYVEGRLVWGSSPAAGRQKVVQAGGFQCEMRQHNATQCGLRKKYCCKSEPSTFVVEPPLFVEPNTTTGTQGPSSSGTFLIPAIGGMAGTFVCLAIIACCCVIRRRRGRRAAKLRAIEKMAKDEDGYGSTDAFTKRRESPAYSIESPVVWWYDDDPGMDDKEVELEREPLVSKDVKFHTAPSISGAESCLLLDMTEKAEFTDWSARDMKSWNGYIHWKWEGIDMSFAAESRQVRRTATQATGPGPHGVLTQNFQNPSSVNFGVDYKKEIEPFLGTKIGEGGFGKVFEATWKKVKVAVKVMKVDNDAMQQTLVDEIKLTSRFHHPNIVKVLAACFKDKENVCLIMELVEGGNLSQRIHNRNKRKLDYLEVLKLGHDIAKALAYLHPTVIHRDLKPQNVLMDKKGRAKIADFGISKFKDPHKSYLSVTQTGGTPNYMAPELFNGTRVDEKCDIFSVGCILYEAIARKVPFSDLPYNNFAPQLFQIIKAVAIDKKRPKIPEYCPHKLAHLIRSCWKENPKGRPSAAQVQDTIEGLMKEEMRQRKTDALHERQASGASSVERSTGEEHWDNALLAGMV
eukprot:evm.model.scf_229.2 EVM.evm.TU.scf_229.2   scf_229:27456-37448(-)